MIVTRASEIFFSIIFIHAISSPQSIPEVLVVPCSPQSIPVFPGAPRGKKCNLLFLKPQKKVGKSGL